MKKNKMGFAAVFFLSVFLLSGCNSNSTFALMDNGNSIENAVYRSSLYWSGVSERTIHINDKETRDVVFDIDMKKGNLSCKLENGDGDAVYTLTKDGAYTGTEKFTLDGTDDYKLVVRGKAFNGSYKISWDVKEDETTAPAGESETTAPAGESETTAPAGESETTALAAEPETTAPTAAK